MTLEFRGVSYRYSGKDSDAVRDASFSVGRNSIVALIGKNGSGKSTLLSLAAGFVLPRLGAISRWTDNEPGNAQARHRTAFLPQMERLSFALTSLEYAVLGRASELALFAVPGGEDFAAAEKALAEAGVAHLSGRPVDAISGGELQLVRIARCLAQSPDLLVFDEPTSMLDPANTARIADTMLSLRASGRTILFSTHDIGLAAKCADHFVMVSGGTVLFSGGADEALDTALLETVFGVPFVSKTMVSSL